MTDQHEANHDNHDNHEPVSASVRWLAVSAASLAVLVVVSLLIVWGVQRWYHSRTAAVGPEGQQRFNDEELLTPLNPAQRWQRLNYERRQRKLLHEYGWNAAQPQTARIPIDRAMTLVERRYRTAESKKSKAKTPIKLPVERKAKKRKGDDQ